MNKVHRRKVLQSVSVIGGVSLAGCSSVLGPSGTVLGKIEIINSSPKHIRIRLIVNRDEENLIDRRVSLAPSTDDKGRSATTIEQLWSKESGLYKVIAAHYDESGSRESRTWEYLFTNDDYTTYYEDSQDDPGCIGGLVKIGSLEENDSNAIGISPIYMKHPCGTENSNRNQ